MFGNMAATASQPLDGPALCAGCGHLPGVRGLALIALAMQVSVPMAVLFFWLVYFNMGVVGLAPCHVAEPGDTIRQRSSVLSIDSLAAYVGTTVASIALGWIAQQTSINSAWIIAGLLVGSSMLFYLRINRQQQRIVHVDTASVLETD